MSIRIKSASGKNDGYSQKYTIEKVVNSLEKTLHNHAGIYAKQLNNPNLRRIHFELARPQSQKNTRRLKSANLKARSQISATPKAVSSSNLPETYNPTTNTRPKTAARLKIDSTSRSVPRISKAKSSKQPLVEVFKEQQQPEMKKSSSNELEESRNRETVCPLEYADLPLVTEHDHLVLKCYCYLCTCGNHLCPAEHISKHLSPSSIFKSTYSVNFRKMQSSPSLPLPTRKEIDTKKVNGDLLTTHQSDFKPYKIVEQHIDKPKPVETNLKLASMSQYKLNFPNWGPSSISIEKAYHPQYRGDSVKIAKSTTYSSEFTPDILKKHMSETNFPLSNRRSSIKLSCSPSTSMLTTTMQDFRPYSPQEILQNPKTRSTCSSSATPVSPSYSQFTTTYGSDFRMNSSSNSKIPNKREMLYQTLAKFE